MGTRLYSVSEVPSHFKEPFLLTGYRYPFSSFAQCILSVFQANNETWNVWTHLLPSLYFLYLTYRAISQDGVQHLDSYTLPYLIYMVTASIFPLASAVAHMFNTMSHRARHICFFIDYVSLSIYSFGAALAYKAYLFPDQLIGSFFAKSYISLAVMNAFMCSVFSCHTRFMPNGLWKKLFRVTAFAMPYLVDSVPIMYRVLYCEPGDCESEALGYYKRQFVSAVLSVLLYTSHIPERFSPGTFDIIGHSHQLFHLTTTIGVSDQMTALLLDLNARRHLQHAQANHIPSPLVAITTITLVIIINITVFTFYCRRVYKVMDPITVKDESANINSNRLKNGNYCFENGHDLISNGKLKIG